MKQTAWLSARHRPSGRSMAFQIKVSPGEFAIAGRRTPDDTLDKMSIPFDPFISRRHFSISWDGDNAIIKKLPGAKLPINYHGNSMDEFAITLLDFFVISETRFTLLSEKKESGKDTFSTITIDKIEETRDKNPALCLNAILSIQPILISNPSSEDFQKKLPSIVLSILPPANSAMVLKINQNRQPDDDLFIDVVFFESRKQDMDYFPSRTLASRSLKSGLPESHLWQEGSGECEPTACPGVNWAVCAPMKLSNNENYALYATGISSGDSDTLGETDRAVLALIAQVAGQYLQNQFLQKLEGQLSLFFPPKLREFILQNPFSDKLKPNLQESTILFFDIRGFSKASEKAEDMEKAEEERVRFIFKHQESIFSTLSVVSKNVFDTGGVVVDYIGDAVLAVWGPPLGMENHADKALEAAKMIVEDLSKISMPINKDGGRRDFFGIGISSGDVLAGNMGTSNHIKYSVMGVAVNTASRLEGLTKQIRTPVLISGETIKLLYGKFPLRRVAKIVPAGMTRILDIYEMVFSEESSGSHLSGEQIQAYEEALVLFEKGNMEKSEEKLMNLPACDPVRRFLQRLVSKYIMEGIPADWDGVIKFQGK